MENFIFMWNGLNNLSLLIYFQCQHYFIYRIDDVRTTKKEIYFNLNSHHDAASFETIFNRKKEDSLKNSYIIINFSFFFIVSM